MNQQHVRIVAERFQHDLHAAVEQQEQRHRVAFGGLFPLGKQHDREQHDHRDRLIEEHRVIAASQVAEESQPFRLNAFAHAHDFVEAPFADALHRNCQRRAERNRVHQPPDGFAADSPRQPACQQHAEQCAQQRRAAVPEVQHQQGIAERVDVERDVRQRERQPRKKECQRQRQCAEGDERAVGDAFPAAGESRQQQQEQHRARRRQPIGSQHVIPPYSRRQLPWRNR